MLQFNVLKSWVGQNGLRLVLPIVLALSSIGAQVYRCSGAPAASLTVSPAGGVFSSNVLLTLSGAAKEIRYTLDGTEPGTNSMLYSAPLLLTNSAFLQARGFSPDWKESFRLAQTYTLLETNSLVFTSSLPLVVINTFGRQIVPGTNVEASIRFINTGQVQVASLTAPPDFDGRVSIKTRGYTSLRYPKKSYTFEVRDREGNSMPVSILGMPRETDWVLYAPYPDKSLMRDVLAYELSRKLGHYASRTRFVEVFVNDASNRLSRSNYAGVYVLEEKIKRGDNRVALAKLSAHDETGTAVSGGYIFKKDHLEEMAGEVASEIPGRTKSALIRGKFPTGPGAFPADPGAFPAPDPAFTNALSIATNILSLTNVVASTNFVVSALAVTVVSTNSVVVTNSLSVTNTLVTTNSLVSTNRVLGTNALISSRANVATNPVVSTASVAGTNSVATTNAVDANTAVVTRTVSVTTSTTYRTNLVVVTNTLVSTNFIAFTNLVLTTNVTVATNITVVTSALVGTNLAFSTNVYLLTSQRPVLLERLVTSGKGFVTSHTNAFFYVEPKATRITEAQRTWLLDYINRFEQALYGPDFRNPTNGYAAYIDPDSFIDHHLFVEATKNIDGFRFSTFFTKDRAKRIRMEPIWDWNLSFGNAKGKQGYMYDRWYWPQLDDQQYSWFRRLFEDPDFAQRYVDRWAEWRTNLFASSNLLARVDHLAGVLKEPASRNFTRWPILGEIVDPEHYAGKTYEEEIGYLKTWITNRISWMTAQFVAPPVPSDPGGTLSGTNGLTLTVPTGEVFFTTDGADPRVSGGGVAATAKIYQAPIAVTNSVTVTARTRKDNRWSNPVVVRLVLLRPPLQPAGGG